jgi:hypothetical protein
MAYVRWLAASTAAGAIGVVAALWTHHARPQSIEDFYSTYDGRFGIPTLDALRADAANLDPLPGWFFERAAAGQMLLALIALWLAAIAGLRPDALARHRTYWSAALSCALALAIWVVLFVLLFPGLLDPWVDIAGPFDLLAGAWVAAAAALVTALSLLALAWRSRRACRARNNGERAVIRRS